MGKHLRYRIDWTTTRTPEIRVTKDPNGLSLTEAKKRILEAAWEEQEYWKEVCRQVRRITAKDLENGIRVREMDRRKRRELGK